MVLRDGIPVTKNITRNERMALSIKSCLGGEGGTYTLNYSWEDFDVSVRELFKNNRRCY